MLNRRLSHDLPRNRGLALLLVVIVLGLALTPFLFPGTKALNVAAKIIVFIVLVASFRSEERRVGKECARSCRSRWSPYH